MLSESRGRMDSAAGPWVSVGGHFEEVEDPADISVQSSQGLGDGQLALGQQSVGGEGFSGDDVELVEQRDDGADLVGAFGLVVGAGLEPDFLGCRWPWCDGRRRS